MRMRMPRPATGATYGPTSRRRAIYSARVRTESGAGPAGVQRFGLDPDPGPAIADPGARPRARFGN